MGRNMLVQDAVATVITLGLALAWLRLMDALAHRGVVGSQLSRKIIHIGTGPLFVACWNLFSPEPQARWLAALVPGAITLQFLAVGLGLMRDDAAVAAMTRTGDRREILRGPLYYGVVFVLLTLVFWRESPAGIMALMALCGGDGLADIVGRRLGTRKLPGHTNKSWAGSLAMFSGSFIFGFGFVVWFSAVGYFPLDLGRAALVAGVACLAATVVEALSPPDIDNLLIVAVVATISLLF
jgi:phytol kinase